MSNILFNFSDTLRTCKVLVPWPAAQALKAGAPLDADGAVSNDDDAIGILLENGDVGETKVINGAAFIECELMTAGYLDQDAAEASCGLTYDDDLIAELSGITFVQGGVLPSGGGGGEGPGIVFLDFALSEDSGGWTGGYTVTSDVTAQDVKTAVDAGNVVIARMTDSENGIVFYANLAEHSDAFIKFAETTNTDLNGNLTKNGTNAWAIL